MKISQHLWMGQNFDDYPGFQQIPGMPILLQHSVPIFEKQNHPKIAKYCKKVPMFM